MKDKKEIWSATTMLLQRKVWSIPICIGIKSQNILALKEFYPAHNFMSGILAVLNSDFIGKE
ncbi:hypothetical protein KAW65_07210 [candidate division WOR-3 bacterium]|nr:hypothetical protein [candidate division WOR-3 bacterium]